MSIHRINAALAMIAFQNLKEVIETDFEAVGLFGGKPVTAVDFETIIITPAKVTQRQKAPNHRRPEKRLRKSK